MKLNIQKRWADALRSKLYDQSYDGSLRNIYREYSALGVLVSLYLQDNPRAGGTFVPDLFDDAVEFSFRSNISGKVAETQYLPVEVIGWAGTYSNDPVFVRLADSKEVRSGNAEYEDFRVSSLEHDLGLSFEQLADRIEFGNEVFSYSKTRTTRDNYVDPDNCDYDDDIPF